VDTTRAKIQQSPLCAFNHDCNIECGFSYRRQLRGTLITITLTNNLPSKQANYYRPNLPTAPEPVRGKHLSTINASDAERKFFVRTRDRPNRSCDSAISSSVCFLTKRS